MNKKSQSLDDILSAWAVDMPPDMTHETPRDKLLDSFLRFFENLSAAPNIEFPKPIKLFFALRRAMYWQWLALNIKTSPMVAGMAPTLLTAAMMRWLKLWQADKTPGSARLMAAIDRDLERIHVAMQYALPKCQD